MLAFMLILYTQYMSRQTAIYITTEHPDDILFRSSDAAFRTENKIVMCTSWCQVGAVTLAFCGSFLIQAVTGYKGWKLSFILVFLDHFSAKL